MNWGVRRWHDRAMPRAGAALCAGSRDQFRNHKGHEVTLRKDLWCCFVIVRVLRARSIGSASQAVSSTGAPLVMTIVCS
jgi:hypothetical protein